MRSAIRHIGIGGIFFAAALPCSSRALLAGQAAAQGPTAAEMSKKETVSAAFLRGIGQACGLRKLCLRRRI